MYKSFGIFPSETGVCDGLAIDSFSDLLITFFNVAFYHHTLDEILLLKSRFPDEIVQYNAFLGDEIVGGITFYVMGHVLHGQYSGTNDVGKQLGAMEAIYNQVMYHDYTGMRYLDFGTSNEDGGVVLNEGLIAHKEGYGGRTLCYDTYEWTLS